MPPKKSTNTTSNLVNVYTYSHKTNKWNLNIRQPREFDNLFLHNKNKFMLDLLTFLDPAREAWYKYHNIPYRRGYFLYGPPGTGKTSVAMAIATLSKRPIYFMPSDMCIDAVTQIPLNSVVLLEDADKMIMADDAEMRMADPEPVSETTTYPNIDSSEFNIWLKAIRTNAKFVQDYNENYKGTIANMDCDFSAIEALSEGILSDMRDGYDKPKPAIFSRHGGGPCEGSEGGAIIMTTPAETEEEYKERREQYKQIIKEANRLRRERYDNVRFDQAKIQTLLQIVDGVLTPQGAIFMMSTNCLNDIHSALLRPGRMDYTVEITYLTEELMSEMLEKFKIPKEHHMVITESASISGRHMITGAQLQGKILEYCRHKTV